MIQMFQIGKIQMRLVEEQRKKKPFDHMLIELVQLFVIIEIIN